MSLKFSVLWKSTQLEELHQEKPLRRVFCQYQWAELAPSKCPPNCDVTIQVSLASFFLPSTLRPETATCEHLKCCVLNFLFVSSVDVIFICLIAPTFLLNMVSYITSMAVFFVIYKVVITQWLKQHEQLSITYFESHAFCFVHSRNVMFGLLL